MSLRVAPLPHGHAEQLPELHYDAALTSVGYEQRSAAVAQLLRHRPERTLAVEFDEDHTDVFLANRETYKQARWIVSPDAGCFESLVIDFLRGLPSGAHVLVDISSMTRWRIGAVIATLAELDEDSDLVVDLLYLPAVYVDPPEPPAAVLRLRPTNPFFAGSLDAEGPPACIIGLGYEPEKAAGTIETLEASEVIAFVPNDPDGQFLAKVEEANRGLLRGHYKVERFDYDIADPFGCFADIEQLVVDLIDDQRRPALVPLGPKIFAACCLLVGARHPDEVSVWRASFQGAEDARDQPAAGPIYGLRITTGSQLSPCPDVWP